MARPPVRLPAFLLLVVCTGFGLLEQPILAEQKRGSQPATETQLAANSSARQAKLESALAKMLSGATLEGSFTQTGAGGDPTKLAREKYTLGEVKKVAGDVWQFPARIQYGEKDVTLPILVPIHWAGDTPLVAVDQLPLPGFGTVSARVMFFEGHYAGYWKHGNHGGHLFGIIHPAENKQPPSNPAPASPGDPIQRSSGDSPAEK